MNEEIVEALMDVREMVEKLPRYDDQGGIHQDNQNGRFILRDDVLGVFALYLGGSQ
jgi:hypothetical protein